MAAKAKKAKSKKKSGPLERRCSKCKKDFASVYSKKRHQRKKFDCSKKAAKKRAAEQKERRKSQNKAYYLRRKWGISLTRDPLPNVLDRLLSQIPESSISTSGGHPSEASLQARLKALK